LLKQFLASSLAVVCLLAGCGPSAEEQKRAAAIKHMTEMKTPGYVRALNLSSDPLEMRDRGRLLSSLAEPETATKLIPVGVGDREITLASGGKTASAKVKLVSNEGVTLLVGRTPEPIQVTGEMLVPDGVTNVRVVWIGTDGKQMSAGDTLTAKGVATTTRLTGELGSLTTGNWTISNSRLAKSVEAVVEDKCAYTLALVQRSNGKFDGYWMLNTRNEKPSGTGQSAS
jgi:hypothetical protein